MKFLKKHFTKFLMAFTLAFTSLFFAFGCNTYASTNTPGWEYNEPWIHSLNLAHSKFTDFNNNIGYLLNDSIGADITYCATLYSDSYDEFRLNMYLKSNIHNVISSPLSNPSTFSFTSSQLEDYYCTIYARNTNGNVYDGNFDLMLNEGSVSLDYFPYGDFISGEFYEQLQTNYNDLNAQYINLKNRYNYGFFADLSSLALVGFSNGVQVINDSYNLQDLINQNLFSNGTFLLNNFISSIGVPYDNASIKFNFAPNLIPNNVDITFVGNVYFNFNFQITYSNNQYIVFPITEDNNFISHTELNNYSISSGNAPISNFKFSFNNGQYIPNMNFSTDYAIAYNTGFNDGQNVSFYTIKQLENNIDDLNFQVANMASTINTLRIAYNDLNTSYTNMLNGNTFANLFFTISETPFASFKQIWNVDFLGVNLAGFVTGILFLGLVIWVIKKIF